MKARAKALSIVVLLIFMISTVTPVLAQDGHDGRDLDTNDNWIDDMLDWAKKVPRQFDDNGREIPIDATPYFMIDGNPAPRGGSRVLNACGSGYNQEGGGTHSYLLIKNNDANYPNATKRQEIIDEFDDVIWATDTSVFGSISTSKIDICVYTMDGVGGVGGYFAGGDNIWIDAADVNGWGYQIMAHEFQHLIHSQHDGNEELWLNEGNSDLAIVLCYGGQASGVRSHIMSFEDTPDNDLTVFDNQGYDYGSALAFTTYIWEHFGGNATITHLVDNAQNGISSVTGTLSAKGYTETGTEAFFRWTVANIMDDTSFDGSKWGYDEIDVDVDSTIKNSYPTSGSGSTHDWAADYFTFTNSGAEELEIDFNGASGDFRVYVGMVGRLSNPSKVERMTLDGSNDGTYTVEDFGSQGTYNKAHLIIATSNNGGSYSFDADIRDSVPPITTMSIDPLLPDGPTGWYVTVPTITMEANEQDATIYYHWDSEPDTIYSEKINGPQGQHTLYYHAVDSSSNMEIERGFDIKVDTGLPVTTISVDPAIPDGDNNYYVTHPTITFSSNEAGPTYFKWDEEADWTEYTGVITVPEGDHKVNFYSEDLRGNSELPQYREFRIDTSTPSTALYLTPEEPSGIDGWYTAPPSISLITDDDASIFYWWDTDPEGDYKGDMIAMEGTHTLHYYSIDIAGNTELEQTVEVKVDTVVPVSVLTLDPWEPDGMNDWFVTHPEVTLEIEEDFAASIYYKLTEEEEEYILYDEEFELEDGSYVLHWYAIDPAGNKENEHIQEIDVDSETPVTKLTVTPNKAESEWYTETPMIEFDVSDENAIIYYHWDYDQYLQLSSTLTIPEGRHVLYYYAMDEAGNVEDELNREFRIDTQRPVAILNCPVQTDVDKAVTIDGKSSKDNNEVVSYYFDFGDNHNSGWLSSATTTHTYKKDGTFSVTLKVKDKAGLESTPQSKQIKVKKKSTGGGGIFNPDPDDPNDPGITGRTVNIAGTEFPFLLLLLLIIIILVTFVMIGVAARRRGKKKKAEAALKEDEDMERSWRARRAEDDAYDDVIPMRSAEPVAFGYAHYDPEDNGRPQDDVDDEPYEEPDVFDEFDDPNRRSSIEPTPRERRAPIPKDRPVFEDISVQPVTKAPAVAPAVARAPPPKAPPKRTPPPKAEPAPRPVPKKEPAPVKEKPKEKPKDDIDIDSEIGDILSRLNGL